MLIDNSEGGQVEISPKEDAKTHIYILPPFFFSSLVKDLLSFYREVCNNVCSSAPYPKVIIPVLDCDLATCQYLAIYAKLVRTGQGELSVEEALALAERVVRTYVCALRAREKRGDYQSDYFCVLDNLSYLVNVLGEEYLTELIEYLEKITPRTTSTEDILKEMIPECSDKCFEYKLASRYGAECGRPLDLLRRVISEYSREEPVLISNDLFSYIFTQAGINSRVVIWDGRSSKDLSKL